MAAGVGSGSNVPRGKKSLSASSSAIRNDGLDACGINIMKFDGDGGGTV